MGSIMHDIIHGGQDTRVVEVRRAEVRKVPFGFNPRTETIQPRVVAYAPSPAFGFRGSK